MAEMVWCNSCKKVVWAYDHQRSVGLGGICSMLQLPCPKCGKEGNFDGWGAEDIHQLRSCLSENDRKEVFDPWSAMKYIAKENKVEWCPSRDNRWFPDPAHSNKEERS